MAVARPSFGCLLQHRCDRLSQWWQGLIDHTLHGLRIDFPEIGMHENIAEAADLSPRDCGVLCFQMIRKLLGRFALSLL